MDDLYFTLIAMGVCGIGGLMMLLIVGALRF